MSGISVNLGQMTLLNKLLHNYSMKNMNLKQVNFNMQSA